MSEGAAGELEADKIIEKSKLGRVKTDFLSQVWIHRRLCFHGMREGLVTLFTLEGKFLHTLNSSTHFKYPNDQVLKMLGV